MRVLKRPEAGISASDRATTVIAHSARLFGAFSGSEKVCSLSTRPHGHARACVQPDVVQDLKAGGGPGA